MSKKQTRDLFGEKARGQEWCAPGNTWALKEEVQCVLDAADKSYAGLANSLAATKNISLPEVNQYLANKFHMWIDELSAMRKLVDDVESEELNGLILELKWWIETLLLRINIKNVA